MYKYAGIIINNESTQVDRIFTYAIPEELNNIVKLGQRVKVPFGKGNKEIDGFIFELRNKFDGKYKIKNLMSICDDFALFTEKNIQMIKLMKKQYICTYLDCIKLLIPTGITRGMKQKTNFVVLVNNELKDKYNKNPYLEIYSYCKGS